MMHSFYVGFGSIVLLLHGSFLACIWDSDTILTERSRFPEVHEMIAGYFVRHSDDFYRWRIENRTAKPIDIRTPTDYDDIAVAYDKLGQHQKAIETMKEKRKQFPNKSLYETKANLGTFLIHAGELEQGLVHITKAIEINPEAHFGREIYQKLLVQYVLECRKEGAGLPLRSKSKSSFASFVIKNRNTKKGEEDSEMRLAIKGVMGMMRFGHYDSPILLEALGDLLSSPHYKGKKWGTADADRLAVRAYLRAAAGTEDQKAKAEYHERAELIIQDHMNLTVREIEELLGKEIRKANELSEKILKDEQAWIASGQDVDQAFQKKYLSKNLELIPTQNSFQILLYSVLAVVGVLVFITVIMISRAKLRGSAA